MTKIEQAISSARGEMRHLGLNPEDCTATDAEKILDDLGRKGVAAGLWFWAASDAQIIKFRKEWDKWRNAKR